MALLALALTVMLALALGFVPKAIAEPTGDEANEEETSTLEFSSLDELPGKKLGMLSGTTFDILVTRNIEGVSQDDILYFNSHAEIVGALQAGRVDAMVTDLPIAQLAVNQNAGIGLLPEFVVDDRYAYVLQKNSPLTEKVNERILAYQADGTTEKLMQKWAGSDEDASPDNEPINFLKNNEVCGMCVELIELVARDLGYGVEFRQTNMASLIAEVQSGKADIAAYSFSITEERKKMVDMTEPYYEGGVTVVVRTVGGAASDQGFLEGLAASFERTFIVEDRWMLILGGLGVTLLIAVAAGLLGLALGFLLVLLRRRGSTVAQKIIGAFEGLMGGLPIVVVLMVFYYVVFGAFDISGTIVAILVFTLVFAASSGSVMWNAIRAVDVGQTEAGRTLGFSDTETFFRIVLPQAPRQFAPLLRAQFITLLKDTAIVGYIAVQDLTRVGDLIRARTMEAFFPLIAIAVIYFLLCLLMAKLIDPVIKKLEPENGPRAIKGVKLQ